MSPVKEMLRCESCGNETARLFEDGDHCAVCHLYHLSATEEGTCTALRMIAAIVTDAVKYEGVHPEDVRETVERTLASSELVGLTGRGRMREISAELYTHRALLRAEVG